MLGRFFPRPRSNYRLLTVFGHGTFLNVSFSVQPARQESLLSAISILARIGKARAQRLWLVPLRHRNKMSCAYVRPRDSSGRTTRRIRSGLHAPQGTRRPFAKRFFVEHMRPWLQRENRHALLAISQTERALRLSAINRTTTSGLSWPQNLKGSQP
jgi:hypothetical protein